MQSLFFYKLLFLQNMPFFSNMLRRSLFSSITPPRCSFCRGEQTYLSQGTPLYRSGRAAFPHPAPHMANRMSDLCVSDTFLLEISFLVMPISVYWASFFLGYCHMQFPSLQQHYPPSTVLQNYPTTYISFVSLLFIDKTYSAPFFLKLRKYRFSPVDIQSLYYMNRSFRRRGAV